MSDTENKYEVLRVGVRVPPFWPEEPALWFAQVESQFVLSKITADDTKFCYLVSQLDHQYAKEVKDIITNPPSTNKYDKLKLELIKRLSASHQKRVKQLLMHEELGDRNPSQFLRHLTGLAGVDVPTDFLVTLWSSRLPQNIQTVIASQMDLPIDKLGEIADKVHEIATSTPQISSATPLYEDMAKQINELTKQVSLLTRHMHETSRPSAKRYNRSRSHSRNRKPPPNHQHCFYHHTFGSKANKCKQPCSFKSVNSQGNRK